MNVRNAVLAGVLTLLFAACPPSASTPVADSDAGGGNNLIGTCTGGCGVAQVCDEKAHICVDACGGCDGGLCVKNANNIFECVPDALSCSGNECKPGQTYCIRGQCGCLPASRTERDTCAIYGKVCREIGGECSAPVEHEECRTSGCASGNCAPCPDGNACVLIDQNFDYSICLKKCSGTVPNECGRDEKCDPNLCWPKSTICKSRAPTDAGFLSDGGEVPWDGGTVAVPVSNTCLFDGETTATGNCTYFELQSAREPQRYSTCRPRGLAARNAACLNNSAPGGEASQCDTGLTCMTRDGISGLCLKACNAATPKASYTSLPSCESDEVCVNLYKDYDANAALGACMKKCNIFTVGSGLCANYGDLPASCVPTTPDGTSTISSDGSGICIPQKSTVTSVGQSCSEVDSFKGAACGSGLVCTGDILSASPVCEQPCDLACSGSTPPSRCIAEPGRACPSTKSCVNATTGSSLGFCR